MRYEYMTMKSLFRVFGMLVSILFLDSCGDFLSREPQNKFEKESYYSTAEECIGGVNFVYNALWTQNFHVCKFILGNIVADDATKGGENDAEWSEINAAAEFRMTARENVAELMWEPCYRGLTRANYMLDILKDKNFDEESPAGYALIPRLRGECLFIRAFFSYYLVTVFGDVPYWTRPTLSNITDDLYETVPREDIWAQIEADLTEAAQVLPARNEYPNDQWGRITKEAASSFLGKVYLFQQKYDAAAVELRKVISAGGYSLLPDYGDIFDKKNEFSAESIYEIPFGSTQFAYVDQAGGALGQGVSQYQARREGDEGWGYNNPTQDLVNEFEEGDPRLIWTVIFPGDEFEAGKPQTSSVPKYGYFNRKAYLTKAERTPDYGNVDFHYRIIRLSDVYLMYAEASLLGTEQRDVSEALKYLNLVRERASNSSRVDSKRVKQQITVAETVLPQRTYTTDEQLLEDIRHERRVELGMEDNRWWDLLRWNQTGKMQDYYARWGTVTCPNGTMDNKGKDYASWISRFPSGVCPVFPIPQSKIEGSDGKIKQSQYYD